jgi:hypothetical protein
VTTRAASLFDYHKDLAQTACAGRANVFWILDLCDKAAFDIAKQFQPENQLVAAREKELSCNKIPALTIATGIEAINSYRMYCMKTVPIPPPPEGAIYIVVCSEARFIIATYENLACSVA